ncbi:MAG: hypothetical protein IPJ94_29635 [Chloroflexi bacterium]|nr:hypothetical protein [Chloroflexota bacterium]
MTLAGVMMPLLQGLQDVESVIEELDVGRDTAGDGVDGLPALFAIEIQHGGQRPKDQRICNFSRAVDRP